MLRTLFGLVALAATVHVAPAAVGLAPAAAKERPRAFIELFTSQGCSSCPAADAFVGELSGRSDVIAVTMPVRLWDFLGWADTLASDDLTKRQIAYSVARGDRDLFTPQMMGNGEVSLLGSDRSSVLGWVRQQTAPLPLPIDLSIAGDVLTISVGEAADLKPEKVTLWLLVTTDEARVAVGEGENRGRRLTYFNVVRTMRPVGMWKGSPMTFDLPLSDIERRPGEDCVVIAQAESAKGPGRIVGAARLDALFPARTVNAVQ